MTEKRIKVRRSDLFRLVADIANGDTTIAEAKASGRILESQPTQAMQQTDPTMFENDSIDAQIDKFLLDADPSGASPDQEVQEEAKDDEPLDPNIGKPKLPTKRLDVMTFASDVARLVEKSENLLDVKGTIVRRAVNYVTKNYDPKQSRDVRQVLENNFGVSVEPGSDPYQDETTPFAGEAGPFGQGG